MKVQEANNATLLNKRISEIIISHPGADEVLKLLGISAKDFEDETLIQACATLKLDENDALVSLQKLEKSRKYLLPNKYHTWPINLLIQFLKEEHHSYTISLLENAAVYQERVHTAHKDQFPELSQIQWYFENLKEKMLFHIKFQEEKFFPLAKTFISNSVKTDGKVRSMEKQIQLVQKDQDELEYSLHKIAELSNDFTPPANACTALCLYYHTLFNLKEDLEVHHFVENEYLISTLNKSIDIAKS